LVGEEGGRAGSETAWWAGIVPRLVNFYMDDSGTRKPNRAPLKFDSNNPNFFALGGLLVNDEDEQEIRDSHEELCKRWSINYPLHSVDIRHCTKNFTWLKSDETIYRRFMVDLNRFVTRSKILCLGCVIDRPGYDERYREKYGRNQWHLCQTAFYVAVERAAKWAIANGRKLKVMPEQSNKDDEKRLRAYYQSMKSSGCPFENASDRYRPLRTAESAALRVNQAALNSQLDEPQKKYQRDLKAVGDWNAKLADLVGATDAPDTLEGIKARITQLDNLPSTLDSHEVARLKLAGEIFDILEAQRTAREQLFQPVQQLVQGNRLIRDDYKLQFQATLGGSADALASALFALVKQNSGEFRGEDRERGFNP